MTARLNLGEATNLPNGFRFTALFKGPDVYMLGLRHGDAVILETAGGDVNATYESSSIGPLLTFFNTAMLGQPTHYASGVGAGDGRNVVDALEALHPGDSSAIDPRTVYTQVTLFTPPVLTQALPMPGMPYLP